MEQQYRQRQSLPALQPPPPPSQGKRQAQLEALAQQRDQVSRLQAEVSRLQAEASANRYIPNAQAPGHSLTTKQQKPNSGGSQLVVHSTISQDQTAGIEVNDRQLFALLAKKLQISQVNDSTVKPEVSATGELDSEYDEDSSTDDELPHIPQPETFFPPEVLPIHGLTSNHRLQDEQIQLMLLAQQNQKRMAEQGHLALEAPEAAATARRYRAFQQQTTQLSRPHMGKATVLSSADKDLTGRSDQYARRQRNTGGGPQSSLLDITVSSLNQARQIVSSDQGIASNLPHRNVDISQHLSEEAETVPEAFLQPSHQLADRARQPDSASNDSFLAMSSLQAQTNTPTSDGDCYTRDSADIGWRLHIQQAMGADADVSDLRLLQSLYDALEELRKLQQTTSSCQFHMLHRVSCRADDTTTIFLDPPWRLDQAQENGHLRGRTIVSNIELHIERHKELSFLVYKDYVCCTPCGIPSKSAPHSWKQASDLCGGDTSPTASEESVFVITESFSEALGALVNGDQTRLDRYPEFDVKSQFFSPYLWVYHDRAFIREKASSLSDEHQKQINLFMCYVEHSFGSEYEEVDNLLSRGMISGQYFQYLFTPDEVLISKEKTKEKDHIQGYLQKSWPQRNDAKSQPKLALRTRLIQQEEKSSLDLTLRALSWKFDGSFQRELRDLFIKYGARWDEVMVIRDLDIYPLKFADLEMAESLRAKGKKFWDCRHKKYVCYNGWDYNCAEKIVDVRFMIDTTTYRKMHPDAVISNRPLRDDLGPKVLERDEPPDGDFFMLLPPNIFGFNMQEKKWVNLCVDRISPVAWNKQAFESLVVDENTKILITALVTNKITAEKATDLMSGKGNGLIVLLHGGPGTGKTLTAESVAELAEKPLYRVTCGDIGTNPEAVEKYLATVLHLGKTWGCVVLLDEADVFLEQRTLADLQRNALVSVFLRVLEYYDGILILTSNRVGTFDEAFKSRIQLSLHYETLTEPQRKLIWENFIKRLEDFVDDDIDTDELKEHLGELAKYDMNGRQIRNAVTTARQLALYKKKKLRFEELKHVISVASKFDKYLLSVNEGMSDDRLAREDRVR
ncbi:MAG: hypothetical protein M1830_009098 [Pleopsidium flavum]|nr:MAG: hypothetical protein M1830_009098 [Pleopsidium flavum]